MRGIPADVLDVAAPLRRRPLHLEQPAGVGHQPPDPTVLVAQRVKVDDRGGDLRLGQGGGV